MRALDDRPRLSALVFVSGRIPRFIASYPENCLTKHVIGGTKTVSVAFDPEKEARNVAKHGISLARAEEMDMAAAVIREDDRFDYGETRYIAFADIDDALHCLVFTFRGSNVRAISLRKANKQEIRRYGHQTKI
jgi:uncharacterized DUF497 family protein